jgi:hypothetical protein
MHEHHERHEPDEPDERDLPDEAEWRRQEAARQGASGDAAYRLIAQTLAQPPAMLLPADFAAQVARLAMARNAPAAASYEWMLGGVAGALTALAAGVALHFNPGLMTRLFTLVLDTRSPQSAAGWLLWLAVALAMAVAAGTIHPHPFRPQRRS